MRMYPIFSEFLFDTELNLDLKKFEDHCYELKNRSLGETQITSSWKSFNLIHQEKIDELNLLIDSITNASKLIFENLQCKNLRFEIQTMWYNICSLNNFIQPHNHGNSILSGVFYVKLSKSDSLVFENSNQMKDCFWGNIKFGELNEYTNSRYIIMSKENKLVMFPSWVKHWTQPNDTTEDRISLAFNIGVYQE